MIVLHSSCTENCRYTAENSCCLSSSFMSKLTWHAAAFQADARMKTCSTGRPNYFLNLEQSPRPNTLPSSILIALLSSKRTSTRTSGHCLGIFKTGKLFCRFPLKCNVTHYPCPSAFSLSVSYSLKVLMHLPCYF
jgi:hypothetical protein